jgi:hypothetical protein
MVMRKNMQEIGIRPHLWLQQMTNGNYIKLGAPYVMTDQEKKSFLQVLRKLKFPSKYGSNLQRKLEKDGKLRGLKSHDYHIIMQQVLPLCIRNLMQDEAQMFLVKLSQMFNNFFLKVIDRSTMATLRVEVAKTMAMLEKVFPLACFNVMTHLVVHLVEEFFFVVQSTQDGCIPWRGT